MSDLFELLRGRETVCRPVHVVLVPQRFPGFMENVMQGCATAKGQK